MDPDWIRIRIGIQPKMLDPDHTDPQHWLEFNYSMTKVNMWAFYEINLLIDHLICRFGSCMAGWPKNMLTSCEVSWTWRQL
jgi:hypothetical protein